MDAIKCIKERRSVRNYKEEKIPEEDIRKILDCARHAPSANNKQPWEFVVVENDELLEELGSICSYGKFIENCSHCIVVLGKKDEKYFLEDGCAATMNILLSVKALGYGSCWVAGHGKKYEQEVLEALKKKDKKLVSILPIGVPDEKPGKNKKSLEKVTEWIK